MSTPATPPASPVAYGLRPELRVTPADARAAERRTSPRLEVEALVQGVLVEGELRITLRDLGFGGFAVECPLMFTIGSRHSFRFTTETGVVVQLHAETIYARPVGPRDGMTYCLSGFRFVPENPETDQAVQILLDAAVAPLSFG